MSGKDLLNNLNTHLVLLKINEPQLLCSFSSLTLWFCSPDITQPTLTISPNHEVDENSCVIFYCHVEGTQPIKFTWYQNDVIISNQSNNVLTIENIKRSSHNALFHCRATNVAGWKQVPQEKITVRCKTVLIYFPRRKKNCGCTRWLDKRSSIDSACWLQLYEI